jgi:CHAT domain-containing protein/tetratricopeptide (TPR) repeat protein
MVGKVSIETIFDFLNADPVRKRIMLGREPGLMTEDCARELEAIASAQTDQMLAQMAHAHAMLVRDCSNRGIAAVFEEIERERAGYDTDSQSDLSALLERLEPLQQDPERANECAQLCDVALGIVTPNDQAELWALLHGIRAIARRTLGERDGNAQTLHAAVDDCDEALKFFNPNMFPIDWAKTQLNRASALMGIADLAGDPSIWRLGIDGIDAALGFFSRSSHSDDWAMCRMNRGIALLRLGQLSGDADLHRRAVAELDVALEIYSLDRTADQWAMAQLNRGVAMFSLGDLVNDAGIIGQSIAPFDAANIVFTRESSIVLWTRTRQNRANSLLRLSELAGDPAAARAALADFDELLEALNKDDSRSEWGIACMNRANTLLLLSNLDGSASDLNDAIHAYDAALEVLTLEEAPYFWGCIAHNRANALIRYGQHLGDPSLMRQALQAFDAVLEVTDRDVNPIDWASARAGRAQALGMLGRLTKDASLLRASLVESDAAIATLRCEDTPATWAIAQQNRADTLLDLANLEGDSWLGQAAVEGYRSAFTVLTMEAHPDQCMEVSSPLVRQLFLLGEYDEARERLDNVLTGGLAHLVTIKNRPARERAVQQAAGLAELRAWLAIAIDQDGDAALLWLERARGQLLTLALNEDQRSALSLDRAELATLLRAIPVGGAAVLPIISPVGARIAVIPAGRERVVFDDFLEVGELNHDRLSAWFYGPRNVSGIGGYLGAYADNLERMFSAFDSDDAGTDTAFTNALTSILDLVSEHILELVDARLRAHELDFGASVVIVPTGLLSMLPLWAAPCRTGQTHFGDCWTVSLTPSLGVLAVGAKRAADWRAHGGHVSMLTILDPASEGQSRLTGAALEGQMLKRILPQDQLLDLAGSEATASAVHANLADRTHLHFSAHGSYVPTMPSASAILLAGTDRLTLGELQTLKRIHHWRLVVLSACDTGLPGLQRGRVDEFIGLPAGFIQAGAAAVIASHWPVRDDATFFLMWKFYGLYLDASGRAVRAPAEALREASLWLRSVTCSELEALFEPMREEDGMPILRTVNPYRPRVAALDAKLEPTGADTSRTSHGVEPIELAPADTYRAGSTPTISRVFYLGDAGEGWELRRPFADPVHWAAFSATGI